MALATVVYWLANQRLMGHDKNAVAVAEFDEVVPWKQRV